MGDSHKSMVFIFGKSEKKHLDDLGVPMLHPC